MIVVPIKRNNRSPELMEPVGRGSCIMGWRRWSAGGHLRIRASLGLFWAEDKWGHAAELFGIEAQRSGASKFGLGLGLGDYEMVAEGSGEWFEDKGARHHELVKRTVSPILPPSTKRVLSSRDFPGEYVDGSVRQLVNSL